MKVELIKTTEANGKVWFTIKVNNSTKKVFHEEEEDKAKECYQKVIDFGGWETEETVMAFETTNLNP